MSWRRTAWLSLDISQIPRRTQRFLGTTPFFCNKEDEPVSGNDKNTSLSPKETKKVTTKKNLLKIISSMKVEINTAKRFQMMKVQKNQNQTKDLQESKEGRNMESTSSMFQKATEDQAKSNVGIKPELVEAASAVASSLPFKKETTVSELLQILKKHNDLVSGRRNVSAPDISKIVSSMKVQKEKSPQVTSRLSSLMLSDSDGQKYRTKKARKRELYSGRGLDIFTPTAEAKGALQTEGALQPVTPPTLWDLELAEEIAAVYQQAPDNAFEEMIQWTKEGKLWEFPINNEAGFVDDAEFHEHIFLEKYLDEFPKEGPIRHFMELVTCGLSKNPYLSVKEKVEHIHWFRDYFKEKEELLKEIEAHEKEALAKSKTLSK
uniref:Small ribosomal subunit protein mS31 n=1 Tax=Pogona vitticeps TaxID=103695 RepID=A0A6J0TC40_9SAUR